MKYMSLLLLLSFSFSGYAVENPWEQKLPFKEAVIEYKITGTMNGQKTAYIRDYGKTSAIHSDTAMSMFGMRQQQKELVITEVDWIYTYDLVAKEGSKQVNPSKLFNEEFSKLSASEQKTVIENAEQSGMSSIEGLQGSVAKNASKVLGFECDVTNAMGTEVHTISGTGFPLKVMSNTMGVAYTEEAVKLSEVEVSDNKFAHPSAIKAIHNKQVDNMMKARVKSVINQLLAGPVSSSQATDPGMGMPTDSRHDSGGSGNNGMSEEQMQQLQKMMQMFGGGQ